MKISVNDQELFVLSDIQKKVIENDIDSDMLEDDMKRRLQWVLMHKYERCMERLKKEWLPKLKANGVQSVPMDDDALAQIIFDQPTYKNRKERNLERDELIG